jgi:rhamnosyltransferase
MAAFNGANWIEEQTDSILSQVRVDVDLIISDDASTDGTLARLHKYVGEPRVRVVANPKSSGSAGQNFLSLIRRFSAERYDFVAFSDQDDVWHEEKLSRGCASLTTTTSAGYSSSVTAFWPNGAEEVLHQVNRPTKTDYLFEGAGQGCTFVLPIDFYARIRTFFLENQEPTANLHFHDWAIYALSRAWGLPWVFDTRPSLRYRQHEQNDTGARTTAKGLRRRLTLIKSGWYADQLNMIMTLCRLAAPANPIIEKWLSLLKRRRGPLRNLQIAWFCLRAGRRRRIDNTVLIASALLGWI